MHVLLTANLAWNIANFRMPVVEALLARGDRVTVLAPRDATAAMLESRGVKFVHLHRDAKSLNPIRDFRLIHCMRGHFVDVLPDVVLSYTIKNDLFGAMMGELGRRKMEAEFNQQLAVGAYLSAIEHSSVGQ